jgi:hypothetical protein
MRIISTTHLSVITHCYCNPVDITEDPKMTSRCVSKIFAQSMKMQETCYHNPMSDITRLWYTIAKNICSVLPTKCLVSKFIKYFGTNRFHSFCCDYTTLADQYPVNINIWLFCSWHQKKWTSDYNDSLFNLEHKKIFWIYNKFQHTNI